MYTSYILYKVDSLLEEWSTQYYDLPKTMRPDIFEVLSDLRYEIASWKDNKPDDYLKWLKENKPEEHRKIILQVLDGLPK
jgi:hypothetical protein